MERLLEGDESGLDELVRRYQGPLFGLAFRMLGQQAEADDAFQETFLRVYRRRFSYRLGSTVKPWLFQICLNVCRDRLRQKKRRPDVSLDAMVYEPGESGPSPEEDVERSERAKEVHTAMSHLSAKHREVLMLSHFQDLSYPEISQLLDIPTGTVKSRVFHALKKLGGLLSKKRDDQDSK